MQDVHFQYVIAVPDDGMAHEFDEAIIALAHSKRLHVKKISVTDAGRVIRYSIPLSGPRPSQALSADTGSAAEAARLLSEDFRKV